MRLLLLLLLTTLVLVSTGCCAFGGLNEYEPPPYSSYNGTDYDPQHNEGSSSDA